jgi:hypothetical protein
MNIHVHLGDEPINDLERFRKAKGALENALAHIQEIADAMDVLGQGMPCPDSAPFLCFAHALQDHYAAAEAAFIELMRECGPA